MSQISIVHWITAFLIVVSLFALLISIPSFVSMYKLGFKTYVEQLVLLKTMLRKISTGYKITQNQRDIVIVDHINMISATPDGKYIIYLERLNLRVKNVRKYRGKIERRKEKIKRIYE
jgi:hypothetical protein